MADLEVDWDALLAINPDTVGWVYVPGTNINYPIVHTDNDETYLTRDFNGEQSWGATYGCIFLSAANAPRLLRRQQHRVRAPSEQRRHVRGHRRL